NGGERLVAAGGGSRRGVGGGEGRGGQQAGEQGGSEHRGIPGSARSSFDDNVCPDGDPLLLPGRGQPAGALDAAGARDPAPAAGDGLRQPRAQAAGVPGAQSGGGGADAGAGRPADDRGGGDRDPPGRYPSGGGAGAGAGRSRAPRLPAVDAAPGQRP